MAPVYLENFTVCKPPDEWLVDFEKMMEGSDRWKALVEAPEDQQRFMRKVFNLVGMSPTRTYLPPWVNPHHSDKPCTDMDHAHKEFMVSVVGTAKELLEKTGVSASDLDIVVTACSIYCPTPSMSATLVNMLGMRPDVISYSLGGMGCSSGVLGLQLTNELLQLYPGKRALFVCPEIVTSACYLGNDLPRLHHQSLWCSARRQTYPTFLTWCCKQQCCRCGVMSLSLGPGTWQKPGRTSPTAIWCMGQRPTCMCMTA